MQPLPACDLQHQDPGGARRGSEHIGPRGKLQQMALGEVHEQKSGHVNDFGGAVQQRQEKFNPVDMPREAKAVQADGGHWSAPWALGRLRAVRQRVGQGAFGCGFGGQQVAGVGIHACNHRGQAFGGKTVVCIRFSHSESPF